MKCRICDCTNIETTVKVVYNNRVVHSCFSGLKAERWAIDNIKTPCVIRFIYICSKCGCEDFKCERVFTDKL